MGDEDDWIHDEHFAVLVLRERLGLTAAQARGELAAGYRRGIDASEVVATLLDHRHARHEVRAAAGF